MRESAAGGTISGKSGRWKPGIRDQGTRYQASSLSMGIPDSRFLIPDS
jgi:hypothetical protein